MEQGTIASVWRALKSAAATAVLFGFVSVAAHAADVKIEIKTKICGHSRRARLSLCENDFFVYTTHLK